MNPYVEIQDAQPHMQIKHRRLGKIMRVWCPGAAVPAAVVAVISVVWMVVVASSSSVLLVTSAETKRRYWAGLLIIANIKKMVYQVMHFVCIDNVMGGLTGSP